MRRAAKTRYGRHAAAVATARLAVLRQTSDRFVCPAPNPRLRRLAAARNERGEGRVLVASPSSKSPVKWACKRRVSGVSAMCQRPEEGIGP